MTGNCSASQRVLANSLRVVSAKRGNPPLSRDDDKLVIQSDGVSTLARGHKNVPKSVVLGISLSGRSKDKKCTGVKKYIVKKTLVVELNKLANDDSKDIYAGSNRTNCKEIW